MSSRFSMPRPLERPERVNAQLVAAWGNRTSGGLSSSVIESNVAEMLSELERLNGNDMAADVLMNFGTLSNDLPLRRLVGELVQARAIEAQAALDGSAEKRWVHAFERIDRFSPFG